MKEGAEKRRRRAERERTRRANESEEKRLLRLKMRSQRDKDRQAKETKEERILRLKTRAESARVRRANETELRILPLTEEGPQVKKRRRNETEEDRILRLKRGAERMRLKRANETEEQRALRLQKNALTTKLRRSNETSAERILRQLRRKTKLQSLGFSQVTETEEESTLRVTQQVVSDKESRTTDDCPMLMEINRMKVSLTALRSAGLAVVKHHVRIAVEKITGRKVQEPKLGVRTGSEARSKLNHIQQIKRSLKNAAQKQKIGDCVELEGEKWNEIAEIISIPIPVIDDYSNSDSVANKLFVCIVCKEQFNNQSGLLRHIQNHSGLEITNAKSRDQITTGKVNPKQTSSADVATNTENEVTVTCYKCPFCPNSFLAISKYRQHLIESHRANRDFVKELCFPCSVCDELFQSKTKLVYHQRLEHEIFVQCPICNQNISNEDLFAVHLSESHPEIDKLSEMILKCSNGHFCKICGFTSRRYYYVSNHVQNMHSENKSYQCDICEHRFAIKKSLEVHKQNVHAPKLHCCEICGKKFGSKNLFIKHKKEHDNLYKQPTADCKECKRTFANIHTLRVHISAVHKKEKPYQCAICGMAFACQSTLHIHKTLICEKEKAKTAPCPICGKVLENYVVLRYHKANIHRYGNTEETFCHVCNRSFKNSLSLWSHNNICHNQNQKVNRNTQSNVNWICSFCEKSFTSKKLLYGHWRSHREEKPFQCSLCSMMFKQRSGFYLHRKLRHKNDKNDAKLIVDSQAQQKLKEDFNKEYANLIPEEVRENFGSENPETHSSENTERREGNNDNSKITKALPESRFDDGIAFHLQDLNEKLTESSTVNPVSGLETSESQDVYHCQLELVENGLNFQVVSSKSNQEVNQIIADDIRLCNSGIDVSKLSNYRTANEQPDAEARQNSEFGRGLGHENVQKPLPGESDKKNESENSCDDGDELMDHYACQDSPLPAYDEDECKLIDCKIQKQGNFAYKHFPDDPFARQLIVPLDKLKECSVCDEVFYSAQKHFNSKKHHNAKMKRKVSKEGTTNIKIKPKRNYKKSGEDDFKIVTVDGKPSCDICGKTFANNASLYSHRKLHIYKKQCEQCGKSFTRKYSYDHHIQSDHLGRRFSCEICGVSYKHKSHLKIHLKNHSEVEEKDQAIKKIFLTDSSSKVEKRQIISDKFVCESCGKECLTKRGLDKHRKSHTETQVNINCDHCSKSFSSASKLKVHVDSVHLKLKHLCSECGKQYSSYSTLNEHRRIHMGTPRRGERKKSYKLKIHQCEHCPRSFSNGTAYRQHVNTVHLGIRVTCPDCGKEFSNAMSMFKHKRSHKAAQYNFCSICSLSFNTQEAYDRHLKSLHDPTRPFPCDQCQSFFKYHSNLLQHKKSSHLKLKIVYTKKKKSAKLNQSEGVVENSFKNTLLTNC